MKAVHKSLFFILILLLLFSPNLAKSKEIAGGFNTDYVSYETSTDFYRPTIIEGIVVDNETGQGIKNANIKGEAHSEKIPIDICTDDEGYFCEVLSGEENHEYFLNISSPGYENRRISGKVKAGGHKFLRIRVDYNPLDLELSESSGSLERGWIENTYHYTKVTSFTDTRKVVDHYETEPIYTMLGRDPYYRITQMRDYLKRKSSRELKSIGPRDERFWLDYYGRYGRIVRGISFEKNSFQSFPNGFNYFQFFSDWRLEFVESCWGNLVKVWIPYRFWFLYETGRKKIPVYKTEEYTRYRTKTYKITDLVAENWSKKQITVTAIPKNGYDNDIVLRVQGENIQTKTGDNVLVPQSPVSTALTMKPPNGAQGSTHPVSIKAYDSKNRFSIEKEYDLDLETQPKPANENKKVGETVTDKKPNIPGDGGGKISKRKVGVTGHLRDSRTNDLLLHSGDGASVRVNGEGGGGMAWWPTNSNYEHSLCTYEYKEWDMSLKANAKHHLPEYGGVVDSTSSPGPAHKNFSLSPNRDH